jgi:tRNA A-37 threonylcarbamoyl transferase component Bud32
VASAPDDRTRLGAPEAYDGETRLAPDSPSEPHADRPPSSSSTSKPSSSSSGWLSSSGAIDHGRFDPGTLLGGRYRIVGRLGRGGMGEVYRADDLKLGQAVALKFLAPEVDRDPARLTQLHNEVRLARQVSHPNVCRVYDIDEVDGHTFLSMEFVDGEELSSLLRRFGRFSPDRALEIARQICAGLAAAHERGVVHRDLKPANVMLDGAGHARLTDFGLAGVAGEAIRAGTPAYMAPEQLAGEQVTVRSDIYALGLVLYELFTGQRAIDAKSVPELLRKREAGVAAPSELVHDLDPSIDRAILRCLEEKPADRPSSALGVAAALPGGDPLAAALAAGETPSPEMVAASGSTSALKPLPAAASLVMTLAGLLSLAALADRALLTGYVPLEKPPEVLADRARAISRSLGYVETPVDTAWGFSPAVDYLRFARERGDGVATRQHLKTGRPSGLHFWHRSSPRQMVPLGTEERVTTENPPLMVSDMRHVIVDTEGRLVEFQVVPPQVQPGEGRAEGSTNWNALFDLADLPQADFQPVDPHWIPREYADERMAWEGPLPGLPEQRLRVEAAAHNGKIVFFQMIHPWTQPARMRETPRSGGEKLAQTVVGVALILVLGAAVLVARHNLRKGRGDRRGAVRISSVVLVCSLLAFLTGSTHYADVATEVERFFTAAGETLLSAGMLWLLYLALEPYVRKFWPRTLVSWSRLLAGNYLDPQVGRDILLGTMFGVAVVVLGRLDQPIRALIGFPILPPEVPNINQLEGTRQVIATVSQLVFGAMFNSLWIVFALVAVNLIVRRVWITAAVMTGFLLMTAAGNIAEAPPIWFSTLFALATVGSIVFILFRFGLLATVTLFFVNFALATSVPTLDVSKWFFPASTGLLLFIAALAAYGFYASRGGEPLFGRRILE